MALQTFFNDCRTGFGRPLLTTCLTAYCLLLSGQAAGQEMGKSLVATRVSEAPTLDGRLDDPAWANAPVVSRFHQLEPAEFGVPLETTEVRVVYDDRYLYVGVRMNYNDAEDITRNIMVPVQRIFTDDRFSFILDPFLDRRNGYYFEVNANGIQADALIENNADLISEWDGIWEAEATIDEGGWTAEIAIPFATLSFNPGTSEWGINFFRELRKTQESLAWSSNGLQGFKEAPSLAGSLTGLHGLEQGLGLDVIPSATLKDQNDYVSDDHDTSFEPSLDLTYRITPALTAKLTFNTDFSATEVDDRQINLTRFDLFFPEKRDFFLQDAGIFEFADLSGNGRPFFSRTIGLSPEGEPLNLNYGGKLTGRTGRYNIGFLGVQQEASASLDKRDLFVGRATMNVLEESSLGLIYTNGDPQQDRDAQTVGADFRFRTSALPDNRVLVGVAWIQSTDNELPVATPLAESSPDESAWGLRLSYPQDRHRADLWFSHLGESFDPAMGFVNRPGIDAYNAFYRFRNRPGKGWFITIDQEFRYQRIESTTNDELSESIRFNPFEMESTLGDEYELFIRHDREVLVDGFDLFGMLPIAPGDYSYTRYGVDFTPAVYRWWELGFHIDLGDFYDGERESVSMRVELKPSPRFRVRASYRVNDVRLPSGSFTARLMSLRVQWAITNRWSFIPLVQFDNVSENMGINARLRWQPTRGQDLFIVWNRNMLRDVDGEFHRTYQETVVKGVYTFRF